MAHSGLSRQKQTNSTNVYTNDNSDYDSNGSKRVKTLMRSEISSFRLYKNYTAVF